MKKFKLFIITLMLSLVAGQGVGATSSNSLNSWKFTNYEADYYLSKDEDGISHLKVVETFTAEFPMSNSNHGFYRYIPYSNQNGKNLTMESDRYLNISVLHNGVEEQPHKIENEDKAFKVYFGSEDEYLHGTHTYQLTYEFERVITEFTEYEYKDLDGDYYSRYDDDEYDEALQVSDDEDYTVYAWQELYWDTNGTAWLVPFDKVTARVHMDEDFLAQVKLEPDCYVGSYGETGSDRCTITELDDGFSFATEDLDEYENLTYAITFAAGTFTVPEPTQNYWPLIISLGFLAAATIIIILAVRYLRKDIWPKKKYLKSLFTPVQYQPLRGMTVAEANQIRLDRKPKGGAAAATLIEMAVEHKVELIRNGDKNWQVKILSLDGLTRWQTKTLEALARKTSLKAGDTFELKRYYTSSAAAMSAIRAIGPSIESSLVQKKLFISTTQQSKTSGILRAAESILMVAAFCTLIFLPELIEEAVGIEATDGFYSMIIIFSAIATIIAVGIMASQTRRYGRHTNAGIDTSNYYLGLYEYMQLAEVDRLKVLQSVEGADTSPEGVVKLYEKLLPYAMIYGLEKSWVDELNKYYAQSSELSPTWCVGASYISISDFHSISTAATSTYGSAGGVSSSGGDSSGGSGGGGGGGSGGGGGGGGGGGW